MSRTSPQRLVSILWVLCWWGADSAAWAQKTGDNVVTIRNAEQNVSGQKVGRVPKGNIVHVLKTDGSWLWVEYAHTKGWIDRAAVKDIDGGLKYFADEVRRNPNDAENYISLGVLHAYRRDRKQAAVDYSRAIEIDPKNADAYRLRAMARLHDETKLAFEDAREATVLYGDDASNEQDDYYEADAYVLLGAIELAAKHYQEAETAFWMASHRDPKDARSYMGRSVAFMMLKKNDESKQQLAKANEIDADAAEAFDEMLLWVPNWIEQEEKKQQDKKREEELASRLKSAASTSSTPAATGPCKLDIETHLLSQVVLDGREMGNQRQFTFDGLENGPAKFVRLSARVPNGMAYRTVWLWPGAKLRVKLLEPPRIAFSSSREGGWRHIFLLDPANDSLKQVTSGKQGECFDPQLSPDGIDIAFKLNGVLHVIDMHGNGLRPLTNGLQDSGYASWSPDGKRLAFFAQAGEEKYRCDLYVIDADGNHQQQIVKLGMYVTRIGWSPDGSRIAFLAGTDKQDMDLYVVAPDGSGLRRLTQGEYADPAAAWSPDGKRIAVAAAADYKSDKQLLIVDVERGSSKRLPVPLGNVEWPAWSPDGKSISLLGPNPRFPSKYDRSLYVVDVATGKSRLLTGDKVSVFLRDSGWSPDGRQLVFCAKDLSDSRKNPPKNMYLINADGSGLKALVPTTKEYSSSGEMSWR